MVPLVAVKIPASKFSNVDFPEPEGPWIKTRSPLLMCQAGISSTAVDIFPGYEKYKSLISIALDIAAFFGDFVSKKASLSGLF